MSPTKHGSRCCTTCIVIVQSGTRVEFRAREILPKSVLVPCNLSCICVHPHSWSFRMPILQNLAILVMIFRHKASNTDCFSMYLKGGAHVKPERSLLWPFASLALRASQVIIDG